MNDFEKLKTLIGRIKSLIDDDQSGLMCWNMMLNDELENLSKLLINKGFGKDLIYSLRENKR